MSNYDRDHKLAKVLIAVLIIILLVTANFLKEYSLIININIVIIWFFGVNFMGRIIESIRKHAHNHDIF